MDVRRMRRRRRRRMRRKKMKWMKKRGRWRKIRGGLRRAERKEVGNGEKARYGVDKWNLAGEDSSSSGITSSQPLGYRF